MPAAAHPCDQLGWQQSLAVTDDYQGAAGAGWSCIVQASAQIVAMTAVAASAGSWLAPVPRGHGDQLWLSEGPRPRAMVDSISQTPHLHEQVVGYIAHENILSCPN